MKIGLLTAKRAQKQYDTEYRSIVSYLEKKGHTVMHSLDVTLDTILPLAYVEREKVFMKFYKNLETCDLVIAECSMQSTQVGFGLSYLRSKGKPTIIMSLRGAAGEFAASGEVFSHVENMMVIEYTKDTVQHIVDISLQYMQAHIDKRFTMLFPPHLLAQLEERAKKRKVPKAVYIRQLIEKDLQVPTEE